MENRIVQYKNHIDPVTGLYDEDEEYVWRAIILHWGVISEYSEELKAVITNTVCFVEALDVLHDGSNPILAFSPTDLTLE
jgi:hypothetical protein